ncbi:MAG: hypothetical protein GX452_09635 [Ignavibacteriales bacterium]|jgi:hypothetical protein|nr:hypothetical protein [Ignavibacteriales bacterium]
MGFREQKKYLTELKKFEWKFTPAEQYDFKMFVKRDKDEEDFDTLSMSKLKAMYDKYTLNKEKKNFDHIFKK